MTPQPSTSLRVRDNKIRFATALGWKHGNMSDHRTWHLRELPDPTDDNTVHEAMMGMTTIEKGKLVMLIAHKIGVAFTIYSVIESVLDLFLQPPTLAKLICEVRAVP